MRGTLVVPGLNNHSFLRCETPNGWPLDQATMMEEELRDMGIDGMRWRDESIQHDGFTMSTTVDCVLYDEAIETARRYLRTKTRIASLTVAIRGTTHLWKRLKIRGVRPVIIPGRVMAAEASLSSTCGVMCDWDLIFVDTDTQATS